MKKPNRKVQAVNPQHAFLIVSFFALLFLIVRARFGFCFNDEPFCVTLAQRIFNGDALIVDEWHGCQLFSVIMLPFYAVYRLISPSNEGILLFLRHIYCILWWLCCLHMTKSVISPKVNNLRDLICKTLLFGYLILFSPLDYMTISYTSMGLISVLMIGCIVYRIPADIPAPPYANALLFSFFWAILVLCSPFMAAGYVLLFVGIMVGAHRETKIGNSYFFRNFLSVYKIAAIADAVLAAAFLFFFLFSRTDLAAVLSNLPHIFADPEHQSSSLLQSTAVLYLDIFNQFPLLILFSFITWLCSFHKKSASYRLILFGINCMLYAVGQIHATITPYLFNVQMLGITILGADAYFLSQKKNHKLFFTFYGFSALHMLLNGLATNTGIYATSMSAVVAGVAAIPILFHFTEELLDQYKSVLSKRRIAFVLAVAVFFLQLSSQSVLKITRQYWDSPVYYLRSTIQCGSAKGLITTYPTAHEYESKYRALTTLLSQTDSENKKFLSCTSEPYLYLDANLDFATFSAWTFGYGDELNARLLDYQALHPDKIPDLIYCASENDILDLIDDSYKEYTYEGHYLYVKE